MRKQTKLVAVLSTAALLALGASMSSFAATGWAEENGTWVYYDKNEDLVTDKWAKSGDNWFWLDSDGEMATDELIEDNSNYYYVDANGAMVSNAWVAIENENAGDDNEPENHWYYFGTNGKAYKKAASATAPSFKVINGKKYTFDGEGKMLYGWINATDGSRETGDTAWQNGDYYCGDENDGAQAVSDWKYLEIVADPDDDDDGFSTSLNVFDDTNQTRWFWFRANGKKATKANGVQTINGKKYSFDQYGRMNSEWIISTTSTAVGTGANATASQYGYFNSPEDGARVSKGWFQAIPDENLDSEDYNDGEISWFYAQSNKIVASQLKVIGGKTYGFDEKGKMLTGLKFLNVTNKTIDSIVASSNYDTEDKFLAYAPTTTAKAYYFSKVSGSDEGTMKTGNQTVAIDGENFSFFFGNTGSKGVGKEGVEKNKLYLSGMLLKASKDNKYELVKVGFSATDSSKIVDVLESKVSGDVLGESATGHAGYVLINTSGVVQKNKTAAKDGLGWKYTTNANGVVISQVLAD